MVVSQLVPANCIRPSNLAQRRSRQVLFCSRWFDIRTSIQSVRAVWTSRRNRSYVISHGQPAYIHTRRRCGGTSFGNVLFHGRRVDHWELWSSSSSTTIRACGTNSWVGLLLRLDLTKTAPLAPGATANSLAVLLPPKACWLEFAASFPIGKRSRETSRKSSAQSTAGQASSSTLPPTPPPPLASRCAKRMREF